MIDTYPYSIELRSGGQAVVCGEDETILEALERSGTDVPFGCRKGQCGTCKSRVAEGEVELGDEASLFALPAHEREEGLVLLCCAYPVSDLVVVEPLFLDAVADIPA